MSLIGLLVFVAIVAVVLWGISQFPTMDPTLKKIIQIVLYCVVAIVVIVFVARLLGYQGPILQVK